jgi:hypothetical protein
MRWLGGGMLTILLEGLLVGRSWGMWRRAIRDGGAGERFREALPVVSKRLLYEVMFVQATDWHARENPATE